MNYYPHHIGDYITATAHLTMVEDGAYRRLLDLYYSSEKPLPAERKAVYRLARARAKEEQQAIDVVLDEFFEQTDSGWTHSRCDEEIEKARVIAEKARANGKKGGRPPKQKPEQNPEETQPVISGLADQNPDDNPEQTQKKANVKLPIPLPNTINNPLPPCQGAEVWKLPDWVPSDLWGEFEAVRKKRKKPMTDRARRLAVGKLESLRNEGHSVESLLEQSILHAWDTFYPIKQAETGDRFGGMV
ncbi:YdaU family protein [Allopusillimonas ginsengisoli]|uniref:YdaU family protein n=1 Tax=Allopusillimonas ginsengisoli TaxID=453575 RepID=UPI001020F002|nr:YdaU family protein [Allopusillimonas ginsengisoli]TEA78659.1 DUF1376 domain-containing protein [Allopusillimonas ginsengisoli]